MRLHNKNIHEITQQEKDMYASVGKKLRLLRRKKYDKQATVIAGMDISAPTLSNIESGISYGLSMHTLYILADYYKVPIHELFTPEEEED